MTTSATIKCPHCNLQIDVEEAIAHRLEEKYRIDFDDKCLELQEEIKINEASLETMEEALNAKTKEFEQQVELKANEVAELKAIKIKEKLNSDHQTEITALLDEANEDREQLKILKQASIENERLKRKMESQRLDIEIEFQNKMNDQLKDETLEIKKREAEKHELKDREAEKIINDQKAQIAEMARKLEQGSVQLQGEVQEMAIEEWLTKKFPLDSISEIKKGARGADCLHIVHTRERQNCGSIYYESKRTKDFQKSWIEKFRTDMREKGAHIGVLVTDAMPGDMDRMGQKDGIWICCFEEFKGLCHVLRESVIAINMAIATQENKGEKMSMLYDYLTGNEFRLTVEGMFESFTQMQNDLESERRSITSQWKRRQKQIERLTANTIFMHSSIKGIGGDQIPSINALELPAATVPDPLEFLNA